MKAPRGGLRPIHNKSNGVAKVDLRVQAGATLAVQDDVAAQLLGTGAFAEGDAPVGLLDKVDADHFKRFPDDAPKAEPVAEVEPDAPKPAKKAAAKKG